MLLLLFSILLSLLSVFHNSCCYTCSSPIRVISSSPVSFLFRVHVIARVSVPVFIVSAVAALVAFRIVF